VAVASAGPYASLQLAPDRYHASTPPLSFLQAGCPSCRPTNSVKALKAQKTATKMKQKFHSPGKLLFELANAISSNLSPMTAAADNRSKEKLHHYQQQQQRPFNGL